MTVHFEHEGTPMSMLLDLVEVPHSHTGINLANAFAQILKDFDISDKVSYMHTWEDCCTHELPCRFSV